MNGEFEIGDLLYIILTILFIAIGVLGRKKKPVKPRSILIPCATVFFSSACIMILEIVAGRLMAKYLGATLYVWTSVIGGEVRESYLLSNHSMRTPREVRSRRRPIGCARGCHQILSAYS